MSSYVISDYPVREYRATSCLPHFNFGPVTLPKSDFVGDSGNEPLKLRHYYWDRPNRSRYANISRDQPSWAGNYARDDMHPSFSYPNNWAHVKRAIGAKVGGDSPRAIYTPKYYVPRLRRF